MKRAFTAWCRVAAAGSDAAQLSLLAARCAGPLAASGFLWGAAAQHFYQRMDEAAAAAAPLPAAASLHAAALAEFPPDARRAALAVIYFPWWRTLAADDEDALGGVLWAGGGGGDNGDGRCGSSSGNNGDGHGGSRSGDNCDSRRAAATGLPAAAGVAVSPPGAQDAAAAAAAAAGYDPAYLLPFALCCLSGVKPTGVEPSGVEPSGVEPSGGGGGGGRADAVAADARARQLCHWGVLPLCLRALASPSSPVRALAAECLGRLSFALGDGCTSGAGGTGSLREAPQLQALLSYVRQGVAAPLAAALPASAAVLAAEAALGLCHPASTHYALLNRVVLRK
eukprot:360892-Chlamydomonas_euryale.AAC.5